MRITYRKRLFLWFFLILSVFIAILVVFKQNEEKNYRTEMMKKELDNYIEIVHALIEKEGFTSINMKGLSDLQSLFPKEIRLTVIADNGDVLYDKDIDNIKNLESHLDRPEIAQAFYKDFGANIRTSVSTNNKYLYYAKYYEKYFVRVAVPYNITLESVLSPDKMFIYVSIAVLIGGLLLINYASGRFSKSIIQLNNLTTAINSGKSVLSDEKFPDDELGEIGKQLIEIFKKKEENEKKLKLEKEKIIQHFHFSKNGLCIFNSDRSKVYSNVRFMQYLNTIMDKLTLDTNVIFSEPVFKPVSHFLDIYKVGDKQNNFVMSLTLNAKVFEIQVVVFEDKSFEIGIKDVTDIEETGKLKQEMTNNIAHELKTPVASLRGYLETLDSQRLPEDKQCQFIHRAHIQSIRLSNILEDVGLISKMENTIGRFTLEKVNISQVIDDVRIDLIDKISKNNIKLNLDLDSPLWMKGNYTLLYSVFRNLIDNSIDHAGHDIEIYIQNYMKDDNYLYFLYYDTGKGIEEKHLNRLFERFYRADKGRTRETGGSGLGLSIVRNAIKFHGGDIHVKNRQNAGLEFLFTLKVAKE